MASISEQEILQKISVLEDRFREYEVSNTARWMAMNIGPGDERAAGLNREYEVQTTAFRRLIYAENQKLQHIRSVEEERRRIEARALKEKQRAEEETAKKAAKEAAMKQQQEMMKQHEDAVQRAMARITSNM